MVNNCPNQPQQKSCDGPQNEVNDNTLNDKICEFFGFTVGFERTGDNAVPAST